MPSSDDLRFGPLGAPSARNPFWGYTSTEQACLGFMTEFHKCYVQADVPEKECRAWRNDYTECKLHFREKERLKRINEERLRQQRLK